MTVHVIGAGLAGLSACLNLIDRGHSVVLHESAGQAGGRCRSWLEPTIGEVIDNGTHMVVGGNDALFGYLRRIGAAERMVAAPTAFPMVDLTTGGRWTATPLRLLPSLISSIWRMCSRADASITDCLGSSRNYRRFWEPIALAVMNTPAEQASAAVFRRVLTKTLWRGLHASRPFVVRESLSDSLIAPAVAALSGHGVEVRLTHPLRRLILKDDRVSGLVFDDQSIVLGPKDRVILAVPWVVAASLLPGLPAFTASPIVNGHFRLAKPPAKLKSGGFVGILGGTAQWLFVRGTVVSVTVSAAAGLADLPAEEVADLLWRDIAGTLDLEDPPVARRIIKEKRATILHTPDSEALRPGPQARKNMFLAGDWTATGLPCTLEGAIRSGVLAAHALDATSNEA